jgi:hypothetical protein
LQKNAKKIVIDRKIKQQLFRFAQKINKKYPSSTGFLARDPQEERNFNTNRPEMSYHFKAKESALLCEELPKKFCIELFSIWHGYEMQVHRVNFLSLNVTIE